MLAHEAAQGILLCAERCKREIVEQAERPGRDDASRDDVERPEADGERRGLVGLGLILCH